MTAPTAPTTEGGQDPKTAAKEIAAAAIAHAKETGIMAPGPAPEPALEPAPLEAAPLPIPPSTPPAEPGDATPAPPPDVVTPVDAAALAAEVGVPFEEVVEALAGFGIAVEAENVPDDLRGPYGKLLEGVKAVVAPVFDEAERTKAQLQQIDTFKSRLNERPESILLALWRDKPEAFAKVVEIAERAKEDEDYKATVMREVELEARESHLQARESRLSQQQLEEKGRRAEVATTAAARRHGVDPAVADRYVAGMIGGIGADAFDVSSIDSYVSQLTPKVIVPKAPPMITPEAAKAAAAAPTTPAAGEAPPAPGTTSGLTPEATQTHRGGFLRNLIKEAGARVDRVV